MGKVIHQSDTSPLEPMPAKEHLWRRNHSFYFRMRFPRELLRAGASVMVNGRPQKHEIKFSLNTSDYKTACQLVATHTAIWTAELEKRRSSLRLGRGLERVKRLIATGCNEEHGGAAELLSDDRIRAIILRSFINSRKHSAEIIEKARGENRDDRLERLYELQRDLKSYEGDDATILPANLETALRDELKAYGLEGLSSNSPSFLALLRGYRAALIEDARRMMQELDTGEPAEFDPQFKGYHATSQLPDTGAGATLGELLRDFDRSQRAKRVSDSTHKANIPVFRALREHFGDHMPLSKIAQKEMVGFFDFVDSLPVNCQQRYPKKKLAEAVAIEARSATPRLLAAKTRNMYHGRVVTIWEHAKDMGLTQGNPASIRPIASRYTVDKKSERESFTIEELNTIFHAPLFAGCVGDMKGWEKPGQTLAKRGRFWVPLLALFQGFRCNEACQLEIADVIEIDTVPAIKITDESEDDNGENKGKRVKNKTSKTSVPIHPTIIQLGFLDFVKARKFAGDGSNLFPELPRNNAGVYSSTFSKWFGRFLDKTFADKGTSTKGTFHCFRHTFRDATRRAKIDSEVADRLGRWKTADGTGRLYGDGFTLPALRDELAKVEFPGLDLAHLLPQIKQAKSVRVRNTIFPPGHPGHQRRALQAERER